MHITFDINTGEVTSTPHVEVPLSAAERRAFMVRALDTYLDEVAARQGFDSRLTAAIRAGYPGPFQALGAAFAGWMDSCYVIAAQLAASPEAQRDPPATVDDLLGALPAPPEAFR
jgi:hypothetical protein